MSRILSTLGFALLFVGSGPLWFVIIASELGIWPEPTSNPIGIGVLFYLTFWPAVFLLAVGVLEDRVVGPRGREP